MAIDIKTAFDSYNFEAQVAIYGNAIQFEYYEVLQYLYELLPTDPAEKRKFFQAVDAYLTKKGNNLTN